MVLALLFFIDSGFPHYDGGGLLGESAGAVIGGQRVGTVSGRTVSWTDCTVHVNGMPVTGIALFCSLDQFGIKLVGDGIDLAVGEAVEVTVSRST